jgi:hypothetical protein
MEQGLAAQMVYGDGEGQNTRHYYAGTVKKKKKSKKGCKTPKK